jgi:Mg2+ transporter MgtE
MISPPLRIKIEAVKKLIRRNAKPNLEKVLSKLHPADIASIIKNIPDLDRKKIWEFISDKSKIANIILELEDPLIIEFFEELEPQGIANILNEMESDDAANILRLFNEEKVNEILKYMTKDELEAVEELLHYPEDSAGAVMNPNFFALHEKTTVKDATKTLQKAEDVEMVFYVYVTDDSGRLVGVISLRQLIINPPEKTLNEIMIRDVIKVTVDMDREDVAKIVEKYDLLAIPVVDEQNILVGIITVDDIITMSNTIKQNEKNIRLPDFSVVDTKGNVHNNKSIQGKYLVVNFWATWCPPCLKEIPAFVEFYDNHSDKVEIIGMHLDQSTKEAITSFTDAFMVNYPIILFNNKNEAQFNIFGEVFALPVTFIYDPEGKLVYYRMGEIDIETLEKSIL